MATLPTPAETLYQKEHITDDRASNVIASDVICYTLACVAVGLRFISRRMSKIKYEADDWLIVSGLFFSTGVMICNIISTRYGMGKHAILISSPKGLAEMLISAEAIYNFAMFSIKASILYLYHRIFFVSRGFMIGLWVLGVFVACYSITQFFAAILQCMPIASTWDPEIKGYCINTDIGATVIATLNVLTDFIILILPMPILWRLQKPTKEKIQIMGMFLLAGFVCFASIYRCIVIHTLLHSDPSWSDVGVNIWTMVELGIAIVSACLPTMRPLFSRTLSKFGSASEESGQKTGTRDNSDPSLTLEPTRSVPSQSVNFAHLGVLGDLEHGRQGQVAVEKVWTASEGASNQGVDPTRGLGLGDHHFYG